jgi:Ni/Fe-hydrogenase subunit HybB-like protein
VAAAGNIESTSDFGVIEGRSAGFYALLAGLVAVVAAGAWAAHAMESEGHHITGMNNQIVWGMPHVFAIFLIVTASGALNMASLSSVMGRKHYAPYARLSALLAIALLLGGLAVITLDLGRPDRLVIALTHFNMKSVFAWNVFLYTGFVLLAALYLWTLMERRINRMAKAVGAVLLLWRIVLTTGTGLIFGVLVARQAYDVALMAPLFIAMSLAFGTAASLLLLMAVCRWTGRPLNDTVVLGLKGMLVWVVTIVLYLVAVQHGVKLYASGYQGIERFLLLEGGAISGLFWLGQIALGSLGPLGLMLWPATSASRLWIGLSAALVLLGGFAQIYVIVIGGQAFPLQIFPGKEVVESSFYDGMVSRYQPSLPEVLLGLGGVATAFLIIVLGMKALEILPHRRGADG